MGDLVEKVKSAGVVGAGGAGFPTHVKYQAKVEYVIANGAECEPLLYCDQSLMALEAEKIVAGLRLAVEQVQAKAGFIALKAKYRSAKGALEKAIKGCANIHLHTMESFYPAGDEQVLVYEVLGRVVPEGGIPLQVGVVVNNVATLVNVAQAHEGIAVTRRWLTIHGEVKNPLTCELPVGTLIGEAIALAGGALTDDYTILVGGPMMGVVGSDNDPVTKTTSGILVLPPEHPHILRKVQHPNGILRRSKASCDQCMYCTELCPRYLLGHAMKPHLIMRSIPYGIADSTIATSSYLCCECGLCTFYACPLFLSPGMINAMLKKELGGKNVKNPHRRADVSPYPFRDERKISTRRLLERIGLSRYDAPAPFVRTDYMPTRVRIPLKQHLGAPALPAVKAGAMVREGDLVGEIPEGKLSARVHASIPGMVMEAEGEIVIER
ncbi:MAG: SLBB domain-containing protein [Candidatus Eremiobacteraeota bacterium]|nr:SLBB domain-containing protein [Candidatus Eremiobacteraeota bacterium]